MLKLSRVGVIRRDYLFKITDESINRQDEKIILINIVGLLHLLENKAIILEEAEKFLFSPHVYNELYDKGCDDKILELIMKACELEDIQSIIPEQFDEAIKEIKNQTVMILQEYEIYDKEQWLMN